MVTQSRAIPVPLLLTRPVMQGAGFASDLRRRFDGPLHIIETPLLAPRFFTPDLPEGPFSTLILTSQTGVAAFARLGAPLPRDVFCVGARTASAARANGLNPVAVASDAAGLIRQIKAYPSLGKLLHLRGRDARGNIADKLNSAGIDTIEAVIYTQEQQPLTPEAENILRGLAPVLVPLFSPRSARLFTVEMLRVRGISPLFVAAMSGDIALEAKAIAPQIRVADRPDAAAMMDTVALLLADIQRA